MSEPVLIRSPFNRAGYYFGWVDQYGSPGIGVRESYCLGSGDLVIQMGRMLYRIPKSLARRLHNRYNSTFVAGGGCLLYILPLSAFEAYPVIESGQTKLRCG